MAANGSIPAIVAATWTVIATLPLGYRPKKYQYYSVAVPAATNQAGAGLRVNTSGTIEVYFPATTSAIMPLTGVRFKRSLT